jgi:hypothetical protein
MSGLCRFSEVPDGSRLSLSLHGEGALRLNATVPGVVLRQGVEGAVGERDGAVFTTRFETVGLKYLQYGLSGIPIVSGAARGVTEFLAQLVGALVKSRPRWVPAALGVLEGAGQRPLGQVVAALGQRTATC